jgi:hypothetical protein
MTMPDSRDATQGFIGGATVGDNEGCSDAA